MLPVETLLARGVMAERVLAATGSFLVISIYISISTFNTKGSVQRRSSLCGILENHSTDFDVSCSLVLSVGCVVYMGVSSFS